MNKTCGYLDSQKNFHKTQKAYKNAELQYRIEENKDHLSKFSSRIEGILFSGYTPETVMEWGSVKRDIINVVSKVVLQESDAFLQMIADKKELEELIKRQEVDLNGSWWQKVFKNV